MAQPYPADNPMMQGAFEPIGMECDYADLIIDGEIPAVADGFLRFEPVADLAS